MSNIRQLLRADMILPAGCTIFKDCHGVHIAHTFSSIYPKAFYISGRCEKIQGTSADLGGGGDEIVHYLKT